MQIDKFKNIKKQSIELDGKDIIIFGKNGVGKSNLCYVLARNLINEYYIEGNFERESEILEYSTVYVAPNRMYKVENNEVNMGISNELLENIIVKAYDSNYINTIGSVISNYYNYFEEYYGIVKDVLNEIYPDLNYTDSVKEKTIYNLSDGHKSIVYIVVMLLIQKSIGEHNSILKNTKLKKVAIIDEIDLNIHFSVQRMIYATLKKHFTDVRFVVTTHSPIFLSSVSPKNANVYKLENGKLLRIESVYTDDIEEIFLSNFDTKMHNNEIEEKLMQLKRNI